ncbi:hypothetical protein GCM10022288_14120 [Gryllotalpicola kribbensis]|jgi:hypothetical protein|uniref:DUF1795 domain-containing protein n=1 Tax=Gryllotalpicola kribbensis TaxID=993084 RepID=A0ABP8AQI5_9MICO
MNFAEYAALPIIADLDFKLQPGWRAVRPAQPAEPWAKDLAKQLAGRRGRAAVKSLQAQLEAVHASFARLEDPYGRFAVRVPDEKPQVVCTLFYRGNFALDEKSELASVEAYERVLHKPDSEPGARVEIVNVWRETVPAGEYAGQYSVIHYHDLATDEKHDEERVSIGLFPTGSSQVLEMVYTTPEVGANTDHLVELVRESMASMTVRLAPQ